MTQRDLYGTDYYGNMGVNYDNQDWRQDNYYDYTNIHNGNVYDYENLELANQYQREQDLYDDNLLHYNNNALIHHTYDQSQNNSDMEQLSNDQTDNEYNDHNLDNSYID